MLTEVRFKFNYPTGEPVANAPFTITLMRADFDEDDPECGIIVPEAITATTDTLGLASVLLAPIAEPYYLEMIAPGEDSEDDCPSGARYRFVVPASAVPLDAEFLIVTDPTWSRPWDDVALASIMEAKAASQQAAANAKVSETNAAASALAAEGSASAAAADAASALASKDAAVLSANAAAGSATAADTSATSAAASASAATSSEQAAAASATSALASQTAAAASASQAAGSATAAAGSAAEAAASQLATKSSETNAAASELAAKASETNAAASAVASEAAKVVSEQARDDALSAVATLTGVITDMGGWSAAAGVLPAVPANSSFWKITAGGVMAGTEYGIGDTLMYTKPLGEFYKIDNTEAVTSVNSKTGAVQLVPADLGLGSVNNTSDLNKPISTATQAALDGKQAANAKLTALAAAVWAANNLQYQTGTGTVGNTSLSEFARTLLDDADAVAMRGTLQLGTGATHDITVGNLDPTLNRLMKVGDFGLGGAAVILPDAAAAAAALDGNSVASGKYHLQLSGTTWRNLPSGEYLVEVSRLGASGGCVQKATHYSTGAEYERRVTSQNFAKKVLIAGDYGLGSFAERLTPAVAEGLVLDSGFYEVQPQTAAGWPLSPFVGAWTRFLHIRHNNPSGYWTQLAMNFDTRTRMKVRGMSAGVIGDWAELYTQHSVLGTVSQVGGVPTGAIIERGSNASGTYVKFADGTLIQMGDASPTVDTLIANSYGSTSGNMYYYNQTVSFPVPFASADYCLQAGVTVRGTIGTIGRTSVTAGLVQVRITGTGINVPFSWLAIGRWF